MPSLVPSADLTSGVAKAVVIRELVRYCCEDITLNGAWTAPAALQLIEHVLCDVARLPVREVLSASHFVTDLTLGLGEVVHDYLA
jgi:acetoacetate decarboxylase